MPGSLAIFEPTLHAVAGRLIDGQGILPGADRPPTITLASFFNIFMIKYYVFGPFKADCLTLGAFSSLQHFFQNPEFIGSAVVLI